MKTLKGAIKEILEIERNSIEVHELNKTNAAIMLIGYCSIGDLKGKVKLDYIINSSDSKESIKEVLKYIGEEVKSIKEAISYLNNIKLTSEELSKIFVVLKSNLSTKEDYREALNTMLDTACELNGRNNGESTTPDFINKLSINIVEPISGDFFDGAFGLGGGAIEAYNYAKKYGNELEVCGQENDISTYAIACLRMYIMGIDNADIKLGDVLVNPAHIDGKNALRKFDNIVMVSAFGMMWKGIESQIENDKYSRFIYGTPGVSSADWLFISTALKQLKTNGKAAIVTTIGALFRGGAEENLRKKLINFDYIEAIIELPSGLFSNTGIPCAIIVFNMDKEECMKNNIQFINAKEIYQNVRRGKNILSDDNIDTILDIYRNRKIVENISTIIELENLEGGNIVPSRYVELTEFDSSAYGKVKINLDKLEATKTLGDIGSFYRGINITSKNTQDANGNFKIINLADIKNGQLDVSTLPKYNIENNARVETYKVEAGDIIISNKGATKVCVIPEHEGDILISQNFVGIRPKSNYNSEYIKEFLESPIGEYLIEGRKTGTAVAMINIKELKEIPLVDNEIDKQNKVIQEYKLEEERLKIQQEEIKKKLDSLKLDLYKNMNITEVFEII